MHMPDTATNTAQSRLECPLETARLSVEGSFVSPIVVSSAIEPMTRPDRSTTEKTMMTNGLKQSTEALICENNLHGVILLLAFDAGKA